MDLDLIKKEFDNYVKPFDMDNYDIKYKYRHSYRVYKLCEIISRNSNLNDEDILLSSVIGLLHDIGRFEQLKKYSSYDDVNLDHAEFGSKLLFEHSLIERFSIDKKYYEIISFAIRNHNKYQIEDTSDDRKLMFAKIVRDADKIDILKAHTIYCDYKLKEGVEDISDKVSDTFYANKQILSKDVKVNNDRVLLNLAMIFDINTKPAMDIIIKERLVSNLYEVLKNKNKFKSYFDYMENYVKDFK